DMPTSGYSNVIAISKSSVKTEDDLKRVLHFLDQIGDPEMQLLLGYGIEGRHYELVDGHIKALTTAEDTSLIKEMESMNQMLTFIGPLAPTIEMTTINKKIDEV